MTNIDISLLATVTGGTHKEQKPELPPMNGNSTTTGNVVPRAYSGAGFNPRHGTGAGGEGLRTFGPRGGGGGSGPGSANMRLMR